MEKTLIKKLTVMSLGVIIARAEGRYLDASRSEMSIGAMVVKRLTSGKRNMRKGLKVNGATLRRFEIHKEGKSST